MSLKEVVKIDSVSVAYWTRNPVTLQVILNNRYNK